VRAQAAGFLVHAEVAHGGPSEHEAARRTGERLLVERLGVQALEVAQHCGALLLVELLAGGAQQIRDLGEQREALAKSRALSPVPDG